MCAPGLERDPDWEPFSLPFHIGSGRSMFVDTPEGPTIRMRFFRKGSDGSVVGRVWFGSATFGPPGFVHGGLVSFVLDEAMGTAAWLAGYPSIAANLEFDFVELTPLGEDCLVEARVLEVRPKKLIVESLLSLEGRVLVKGQSVFVRLREERLREVFAKTHVDAPDLAGFEFAD